MTEFSFKIYATIDSDNGIETWVDIEQDIGKTKAHFSMDKEHYISKTYVINNFNYKLKDVFPDLIKRWIDDVQAITNEINNLKAVAETL